MKSEITRDYLDGLHDSAFERKIFDTIELELDHKPIFEEEGGILKITFFIDGLKKEAFVSIKSEKGKYINFHNVYIYANEAICSIVDLHIKDNYSIEV